MRLSRREFLALAGTGAAAACVGGDDASSPMTTAPTTATAPRVTAPDPPTVDLAGDPFTLGVASGDPTDRSVMLWTRLLPAEGAPVGEVPVVWEVARDEAFVEVVAAGLATADGSAAHTIHVDATGLEPASAYRYRFRAGSFTSPVGRTRTAPEPGRAPDGLRFAFASCQDWEDGYYTAHPHLAAEGVDLIVFLGDYIYEASSGTVRFHGAPEAVDLAGYRARYALYKSDPGLQAAHAAAPWVVAWDDHEVRENYADGAVDDARRAAAYRAWWEHQPVRLPPPDGPQLAGTFREIVYGTLARFFVLDTRQFRSVQVCGRGLAEVCPEADDEARTMLGADQGAWLAEALAASPARWNVLAQQVVMADMEVLGRINPDQWDGYGPARDRALGAARDSGAENPIVLTGDIHAAAVADLSVDGEAVATEFVGPSLSSRFPPDFADAFDLLPVVKPAIRHADASANGYVVCEVTHDRWRAAYRAVTTVEEPTADVFTKASFEVTAGTPGAHPLS